MFGIDIYFIEGANGHVKRFRYENVNSITHNDHGYLVIKDQYHTVFVREALISHYEVCNLSGGDNGDSI